MLSGYGTIEPGAYHWVDEHTIIYSVIKDKLYNYGLFAADLRKLSETHPLIQGCAAYFLGACDDFPGQPLIWLRSDPFNNGKDAGPQRLNTRLRKGSFVNWERAGLDWSDLMDVRDANEAHLSESYPVPDGDVTHYRVDKNGHLAYAISLHTGVPKLYRFDGKAWRSSPLDMDQTDFLGAGNEPGQVLVAGTLEPRTPRVAYFVASDTGERGAVLLKDNAYDFDGYAYRDPVNRDIIGIFSNGAYPRVTWYTQSYRDLQKRMQALFPGQFVRIECSNKAQTVFVVSTHSDRHPQVFHWLNVEQNSMGLLKNSRPWIDPARMQPMKPIKFTTRDGFKLDAYLTLPKGASAQTPAPLVVLPHGGPWVRDSWGFDSEVQFLASRGYAVLQPNYRGSTGYDWMFPLEDRWDFIKMQNDVSDATDAALEMNVIDRTRVAIMGTSFGAYHAIAAAGNDDCKYRCAVAISGVFDWERMMKRLKRERHESNYFNYMSRFMGDPSRQKERYDAISPINRVDKVRIPVFVAHGKEDQVTELSESKALVAGLRKNNNPPEVLYFAKEGHGTRNIDNTVELYSRIEAFLARHMAPLPAK